jgi:hypothetical protein
MRQATVALRLEGGIGDHVLGLRLIRFINAKYPKSTITVYSDAGGHSPQLELCMMSPNVSAAIPVYKDPSLIDPNNFDDSFGEISKLRNEDQIQMRSHDHFFDAWGKWFFIPQSCALGIPFYSVLNSKPKLCVPRSGYEMLKDSGLVHNRPFIVMNLSKYGADFLDKNMPVILTFIRELLKDQRVTIINLFCTSYDFPHWPIALRSARVRRHREESAILAGISNYDRRIVSIQDPPLTFVAALIRKCTFFLGVDNGLKHIAWAMDVPLTYFIPQLPNDITIARWLPDVHRALVLPASETQINQHLCYARDAMTKPLESDE